MFIAHLPAGYLLTRKLQNYFKTNRFLWLGLVASVLPDIDLFYFYLFDGKQNFHHSYWIHIPFFWLALALIVFLLTYRQKRYLTAAIIFFSNIFLHLALDTVVGQIKWLFPFSKVFVYLFFVPSRYTFWVFNFFFHWTFLFELAILIWALVALVKDLHKSPSFAFYVTKDTSKPLGRRPSKR
ncbi:MAG: metal-dependent hydrolase [Patescibacteria group bacterium]|nr:metal-dependent hydrolase [Patescibacteria group bacterium]